MGFVTLSAGSINVLDTLNTLWTDSGIYQIFSNFLGGGWQTLVMILIACVLLYLAIGRGFEPLLLVPIATGMLLSNVGGGEIFNSACFANGEVNWACFNGHGAMVDGELVKAGLFDYLYLGVKLGIYPCLIFMGVGAMTDFAPLIANPKSLLLGAAAQVGIFATFIVAGLAGFTGEEAASIGIIGGADGPTAILVTSILAPHRLAAIAVAAYSYMALVPIIQPPIMRLLTTKKEREIVMEQLRPVSKRELVIFPIATAAIIILILPSTAPLIGSLMFGNLLRVCGVTERLSKTVQNELCNIVTIFLGITVGATATGESFLNMETGLIIIMGLAAFCLGTAGGILLGKLMCVLTGGKINPLIGSAGVSAVPMAARVSQKEGQKANPKNFLLMHAMGPNVAGVIGSAVAAGVLLAIYT
ncbi:MAG: sodium ion-translocating decarboxylase subunit beta [Clostridia bacterium]|nr:sodium ion-translocating decarboxylase subunit beta [Clostridia bacterium]